MANKIPQPKRRAPAPIYAFVSVGTRINGKNLGVCVIPWTKWNTPFKEAEIVLEAQRIKALPETIFTEDQKHSLDYRIYPLTQTEFEEQGLKLSQFYSREEMVKMQFQVV